MAKKKKNRKNCSFRCKTFSNLDVILDEAHRDKLRTKNPTQFQQRSSLTIESEKQKSGKVDTRIIVPESFRSELTSTEQRSISRNKSQNNISQIQHRFDEIINACYYYRLTKCKTFAEILETFNEHHKKHKKLKNMPKIMIRLFRKGSLEVNDAELVNFFDCSVERKQEILFIKYRIEELSLDSLAKSISIIKDQTTHKKKKKLISSRCNDAFPARSPISRRRKVKIDHRDPRLKHFTKKHLKRLKQSGLTIDDFKARVFEKMETKITEEEFKHLYLNEEKTIREIVRSFDSYINLEDITLWARDKLRIKIRGGLTPKIKRKVIIDYRDPRLKYFNKQQLKELKKSNISINNFKARLFENVESKITKEEFLNLYLNEDETIYAISRKKHIRTDSLSLWAKDKLGIEFKKYGKIFLTPEYVERYKKGESAEVLSEELEISSETFKNAIDRTPEISRRTFTEALDAFQQLVPEEYLKRFENGEDPEILADELKIGTESFIRCASNLIKQWRRWQDTTELIAKEVDPSAKFQTPYDWGQPDIVFTENGLRIIADAKANGIQLRDSVKKYATVIARLLNKGEPYAGVLEFWCLRNPQKDDWYVDPITKKKIMVVFRTPQQLLTRIKNKKKREELKKHIIKTFHIDIPDLDPFF